ncbi:hypothetical protein M408DRAFT_333100 [Serendipita vermifera MAFF 305830]|uniref:Calcineurin-like phosphoesterase domain-containing protein n=1 Tax=Serendipita vermifera MAFF 305830 TaxID=933852 RepID=A0A0C2WXH0_SERVB|nr:hypothetical protein M408DRAFT_333100 [Serendipita vermifera MAFF 305830]
MRTRRVSFLLRSRAYIIHGLRLLWLFLVLWFELGIFTWSIRNCKWPDTRWNQSVHSPKADSILPAHLLVLADTQVLDDHSLPSVSRFFRPLVRFVVRNYLRKGWRAAQTLKPDGVLFLGDMISGGRYARDDEEYDAFVDKFREIFTLPTGLSTYYVVGNNDVGLGHSMQFSQRARSRFRSSFHTEPNRVVTFGNHSLVLVDAPGLVEEDYRRVNENKIYSLRNPTSSKKYRGLWNPSRGGTMEFITTLDKERKGEENPLPIVIFSHIPFARPERSNCGPLREQTGPSDSHIQKGAGPGYQNLLGKATSTWLLETLEPSAVFTADDHDYCELTHVYLGAPATTEDSVPWITKTVRETTVKTFSTMTGVRRPAMHLLSFWNPPTSRGSLPPDVDVPSTHGTTSISTVADTACFLPDQMSIYLHGYLPLILLTFALLIWHNVKSPVARSKLSITTMTMHHRDKSLPLFDSPTTPRFETRTAMDIHESDMTHRAGGSNAAHTTSRYTSQRAASGLRTPISRGGSSPFSTSPLASPVLLPPDMDDDEDENSERGSEENRVRDESHLGHGLGVGREVPRTPRTPLSRLLDAAYRAPASPTGTWEMGTWRKGSSRNSLYGMVPATPAPTREESKERRKASEGWRQVSSERYDLWRVAGFGRAVLSMVWDAVLGRVGGDGPNEVLWRRCVWDAVCVALPCWLLFGLVDSWFIW